MPFIIPTNNNQYSKFKYLIEKYRETIETSSMAHCFIGFTAAAILRNDESADLASLEQWLQQTKDTNGHGKVDQTVLDRILLALENLQEEKEEAIEIRKEDDDLEEEAIDDTNETSYELQRYTSRTPYSCPVHFIST